MACENPIHPQPTPDRRDGVGEGRLGLARPSHPARGPPPRAGNRPYSTATTKRHQVDPFAYLKDVLERLPSHPVDRLGELLPDAWVAAHPQARRKVAS